ncbi:hypothetical protein SK355_00350 [Candidatus Fukatsuia symbiotica]|uniref:Uncharacterized protein n=2 Tax=Candidatus Fukatsuia symbiotica TaxID=1878942 RepID=A0A2U8I7D1_9GAMM|nr:hypothetical protein [Candidatus Fukatsuia symbiotica]AWK15017.1 hypothetical protein CCS41_11945 [Candidatus Fukatsuia symbiotica]MEA9443813.1 hypothetical protein [Candidatus Fukatsuia symbiotica]
MSLYIDNDYVISHNNSRFILYKKKIYFNSSKKAIKNYLEFLACYSSFPAFIESLIRHHGLRVDNQIMEDWYNAIQHIFRTCHETFKPVPLLDPDKDEIRQGIKHRLLLPGRLI